VKAAAGGGGKGMRRVDEPEQLLDAIAAAQREAQNAFSDPRIFLEKYLLDTRHIEVQILADTHGNVVHLFERDCSTQRRHQKILEEAPAPELPQETRDAMTAAAIRLAREVGYENAGTVEFMLDRHNQFYFLEMNTRLQVEHPVTEWITGLDLVREQVRIAQGETLGYTQDEIRANGHAIEARLYAEDPDRQFMPATGTFDVLELPHIPYCRFDIGVTQGDSISIYYDPMIAKLSVWAPTREQAIAKCQHALEQLVILGVTTNRQYLIDLLASETFQHATMTTHWLSHTPREALVQKNPDILDVSMGSIKSLLQGKNTVSKNTPKVTTSNTMARPSAWEIFS
jgi:3-methylcrotonyl-CoA carboxylase alpha subunit